MSEQHPRDQIFIDKLTEITLANLGNESFDAKELASKSGMSHYSLSRKLYAITNKTITQFIRETRLQRSLEMLQNEELTAAEIAYKAGFSSPAYFNTCFHEFFGYPPGKVKKTDFEVRKEIINTHKKNVKAEKLSSGRILILLSAIVLPALLLYLGFNTLIKNHFEDADTSLKRHEKSIAVLPFKNLSNSNENQYFIDGLTDEVLTNLSRIHDLRVISRTSTEQFRGSDKSATEIAKKLHVDYIVEGSGQKYGDAFRLRVQLIEASTDKHIWAESYEQEINAPKDIFKVQIDVAQSIAEELKATITPEEKQLIEKTSTQSLKAHDYFLKGQMEMVSEGISFTNQSAINRALSFYREALKYDSRYALAYTGMADIYWKKLDLEGNIVGKETINMYLDSMLLLTNIAISIDDQESEAYYIRGGYYSNKGNIIQALQEWDKAIKYNPNNPKPYWCKGWSYEANDFIKSIENFEKAALLNQNQFLSEILTRIGDDYFLTGFPVKGEDYLLEALEVDGDSLKYLENHFRNLAENQGDFLQAVQYFEKRCQADSTNDMLLLRLGFYNSIIGRNVEALKYYKKHIAWEKRSHQSDLMARRLMSYQIGYIYMQNGFRKDADYYFLKSIDDYNRFLKFSNDFIKGYYEYRLAAVYAYRGDKNKAYENLKKFNERQCYSLKDVVLIKNDPLFSDIRNEPEFQLIISDVEAKYNAEHERVRKWLEERQKI